jgi:hypothetical protein
MSKKKTLENMARLNKEANLKQIISRIFSGAKGKGPNAQKIDDFKRARAEGRSVVPYDSKAAAKSRLDASTPDYIPYGGAQARTSRVIQNLKDLGSRGKEKVKGAWQANSEQAKKTKDIKDQYKSEAATSESVLDPSKNRAFGFRGPKNPTAASSQKVADLTEKYKKKLMDSGLSESAATKKAKAWMDSTLNRSPKRIATGVGVGTGTILAGDQLLNDGEAVIDPSLQILSEKAGLGTPEDKALMDQAAVEDVKIPTGGQETPTGEQETPTDMKSQGTEILGKLKELMTTREGMAGAGALGTGLAAYGIQSALADDKGLSKEEKSKQKRKRMLISALAALAGGAGGVGAHYLKNKQASDAYGERQQVLGKIRQDAEAMTDDELEHRVAELQNKQVMQKQASTNKEEIKMQLVTARKLGIL